MSIEWLSLTILAALIVLLTAGVPLAFATGAIAVTMALTMFGPASLGIIANQIFEFVNTYALVAVPLFMLTGVLLERAGVAEAVFRALHIWSGRLRGGMAVGTIGAAAVLAAMVGVIGAEIIMLGIVALPAMLKRGYSKSLALGTICAGGSLGALMPPSVVLIFYGVLASVSISQLFLAAVLPALLYVTLYTSYILIRSYLQPSLAPPADMDELDMPLIEKIKLAQGFAIPVLIIVALMSSLYLGIATPTEAAAIAALAAAITCWAMGKLSWKNLRSALVDTGSALGRLVYIFLGASALISFYNYAGGTTYLSGLIQGVDLPALGIIIMMMMILFVLGFFLDFIGILFLTMPIFLPVVSALGFDLVWFGILFTMNMQMSFMTPPFGPAVFYLKTVTPPDISLGQIFKSVWPFVGLQFIGVMLVVLFPDIALWLPSQMR